MATLEEIRRQMEILDEEKENIGDGEYLKKANRLRELFLEVQVTSDDVLGSESDFDEDFEDVFVASTEYSMLANYFYSEESSIEIADNSDDSDDFDELFSAISGDLLIFSNVTQCDDADI